MSECVEIHDSAIGDLSRDLATIHQICASHLNDLLEYFLFLFM